MPTLVIGAGASIDAHPTAFKSGVQLLDEIIKMVEPGSDFSKRVVYELDIEEKVFNSLQNNIIMYRKFALRPSIDEFLSEVNSFPEYNAWRDAYIKIGKYAIIYNILQWENSFKSAIDKGILDFESTWIQKIMPYLIKKNRDLKSGTLLIVTFNYDRMIEYIANLNGYQDTGMFWDKIIHVYGSIGIDKIPFGDMSKSFKELEPYMGDFITIYDLRKVKLKIPKRQQDYTRMDKGASYIGYGKTYFTGFGFDYFNCRNLRLLEHESGDYVGNLFVNEEPTNYFKDRRKETERIRTILPYMTFKYGKCSEFIDEFLNLAESS